MLMALNFLEAVQTKPIIVTTKQTTHFVNYSATHPDEITEYRKSGIILHVYSNASYTSELEARSRSGGYYFLGQKYNTPIQEIPLENGPVHVECSITRNVMASSTEEDLGGLFEKCQKTTSTRTDLAEMGHQKPPTTVAAENTASNSIANGTAKQKRSRAIDIIFLSVQRQNSTKPFPYILGGWKKT